MSKGMMVLGVAVATLAAGLVSARPPFIAVTDEGPSVAILNPGPVISPGKATLHDTMRSLWTDHAVWSRMVTMGVFADMKGCEDYEDRLVRNAQDFQTVLAPYYGDGAVKFGVLSSTKSGARSWRRSSRRTSVTRAKSIERR